MFFINNTIFTVIWCGDSEKPLFRAFRPLDDPLNDDFDKIGLKIVFTKKYSKMCNLVDSENPLFRAIRPTRVPPNGFWSNERDYYYHFHSILFILFTYIIIVIFKNDVINDHVYKGLNANVNFLHASSS